MVASGKSKDGRPAAGSAEKGYLDKKLSWGERLALARAEREQVVGAEGDARAMPALKPWEQEADNATESGPETPVRHAKLNELAQRHPERARKLARAQRAQIIADMAAAASLAEENAAPKAPEKNLKPTRTASEKGPAKVEGENVLPLFQGRSKTPPLTQADAPRRQPATLEAIKRDALPEPTNPDAPMAGLFQNPPTVVPERKFALRRALWIVVLCMLAGGGAGYWGARLALRNAGLVAQPEVMVPSSFTIPGALGSDAPAASNDDPEQAPEGSGKAPING